MQKILKTFTATSIALMALMPMQNVFAQTPSQLPAEQPPTATQLPATPQTGDDSFSGLAAFESLLESIF